MFFLAIRHLISKRKQTVLTLLGIVLGTAAYVAISGMMLGFQYFIIDQLVNNDAHIRIKAKEQSLNSANMKDAFFSDDLVVNWIKPPSGRKDNSFIVSPQTWLERLANDDEVVGASPQLVVQGIASFGKVTVGVSVVGSDPEKQKLVSTIEKNMIQGRFADIGKGGRQIAVGNEFLKKMGLRFGDTLLLSSGKGTPQPFKVAAVFHLGVKGLDETRIFTSLKDAQQLNLTPSRISDIAIRLKDVNQARDKALTYNILGQESVQSWDQSNEGIMSVFKSQDIVRNAMTISILVVAGFGIYNILSLAVTHKRREIAILRSMGFEPNDITLLFLIQGIILGLIGGIVGSALGFFASYYMSTIEVSANRGLGGNRMMVSFELMIYIKAFLLALSSSTFAGFFPARSAGRMEPIDIIRGENS